MLFFNILYQTTDKTDFFQMEFQIKVKVLCKSNLMPCANRWQCRTIVNCIGFACAYMLSDVSPAISASAGFRSGSAADFGARSTDIDVGNTAPLPPVRDKLFGLWRFEAVIMEDDNLRYTIMNTDGSSNVLYFNKYRIGSKGSLLYNRVVRTSVM